MLSELVPMDSKYQELFASKFTPVNYQKGDYFIREGQVSRFLGYIVRGSENRSLYS